MYDFTAALVTFFVFAGVATTAAVTVLVRVGGDLLAQRARVAVPIRLQQPVAGRRAA